MVGSLLPDNGGNILVEFDYNNIIVVDPNKTIDAQGNVQERLVDHENLVMFVNLEAEVLPRTKLAVGGSPQDESRTVSIAKINFLAPNQGDYLSTSYYDEFTGLNSTVKDKNGNYGYGTNQHTEKIVVPPKNQTAYVKAGVVNNGIDGAADNGLLGITSINVRVSTSFIPSVTIELEDVQGKALFSLGDNSPYAAFFNLPYPPFYLTMKGYYGQAIRYQLNLEKFNARFNSFSGNYQVSLEFKGYKFNILNEIQLGHLLATPHMYSTSFELSQSETNTKNLSKSIQSAGEPTKNTTSTNDVNLTSITTEKGYEKIVEVYSDYKSKGLIPYDFPEITLYQLIDKISTFEVNIMNQYTKADVLPLTNCREYKQILKEYYEAVYQANDSWFSKWMDPQPIVLKDGIKIFIFKKGFTKSQKGEGIQELTKIITDFNLKLSTVGTLGKGGKSPIVNRIETDVIVKNGVNMWQIDPVASLQEAGIFVEAPSPEITKYFTSKSDLFKMSFVQDTKSDNIELVQEQVFNFQVFINLIREMEASANKKQSDFETQITAELAKKLEDDKLGLGFRPSVRNITAIIMASAEGFIRLMDETHRNAWNLRNDPVRKNAILKNDSSATSSDSKQHVVLSNTSSGLKNSEIPIYPWPQFFVETSEDVKGRFQLKYIADPSVVDLTKGNMYEKWPEVQFVEEYLKGLTQKFDPPVAQPPLDKSSLTDLLNINAIEFPQGNIAYRNKDELKFFYEIYERQFLTSYYTGLGRLNLTSGNGPVNKLINTVTDYEAQNIYTSLGGSSPYLTYKLKNYEITSNNYVRKLYDFSNQGTGRSYQDFIRDFFVTPYIRTLLDKSYSIQSIEDLGPEPQNNLSNLAPELESVIKSSSNEPTILELYPFTDNKWCETNLVGVATNQGNSKFSIDKVLKVYPARDVIANFDNISSRTVNRPVTNFYYLKPQNPIGQINVSVNLTNYYLQSTPKSLLPTEGYMYTDVPASTDTGLKQLPTQTTTSMFNTPYFVNSILKGVDNWRRGNKTPYKTAAYLFINSLPLISLKEKLKSKLNVSNVNDSIVSANSNLDDLNYMFASLKKFGAIHKLPYAWILKMGSIWHRYKIFKQTNVDILTDVWQDYDYVNGYDPVTKNLSKQYKYTLNGKENTIQLQNITNNINNIEVGFYPKTINDFNVFYNGYDLFVNYTNEELQSVVNRGLKIYNFTNSNISNVSAGTDTFNVKTWSVLLPANIETSATTQECKPDLISYLEGTYIVPSFGGEINESSTALVNNGILTPGYTFNGNNAVFNGSARLFWSSSNYGYFDSKKIVKPSPYSYLNKFEDSPEKMVPFRLLGTDDYTKIDEIFSVFEKRILDSFEEEFLNFSKPISSIEDGIPLTTTYDQNSTNINSIFRNFQLLFKNMMKVPANLNKANDSEYFKNSISEQFGLIQNQIKTFLEYDVIFRYGNPSNYNKRIFASFLSHQGTQSVTDPIQFDPYVQNSLPSTNGGITLQQSKQTYPKEWLELELQVGFSTIPELQYKNTGSYITDFFIDNNIKFTIDNITLLGPIIKMYATQKLTTQNLTTGTFRNSIQNYLTQCGNLQDNFIDNVLTKVRGKLPNQSQTPQAVKQTVIDGEQSKVSTYEAFKALNDKWIAGGDYETKTMFEDILFLDRASRNIGDILLVDIFQLQRTLSKNSLNMNMSVYTFISSILINNKFTIMNLPAYVNFYNVQEVDGVSLSKPEGSLDFANNLWGTFLDVDYRGSSPKMVCFFTGKPSSYLALPDNNYYRFRDDAFDLRRASENPLLENQQGKTDWAVSNRCVGFNVDIGIRNQNIFYSFQVGQDGGKATAESIQTNLNMINNVGGTNTATQNVGLYNYYTQRSYPCTVVSLGNALIQPTMYFNLRHVPMFYGPYMIQEVVHTITPGSFQTQFTGIRQGMFDLPQIDQYLQSINQNLLTKLEEFVKNKKEEAPAIPATNQGKAAQTQTDGNNTQQPENTCVNAVLKVYQDDKFDVLKNSEVSITKQEMIESINKILLQKNDNTNDALMQYVIYTICYVTTMNQSEKFVGYGNNYSTGINLTTNFSPTYQKYFNKKYTCVANKGQSPNPIANFDTLDKFVEFMYDRLQPNLKRISQNGLWQFYMCNFPNSEKGQSETYFQQNKSTNSNAQSAFKRLKAGIEDLKKQSTNTTYNIKDVDVLLLLNGTITNTQNPSVTPTPNNQNTTLPSTATTCNPPTIISFSPTSAKTAGTMPQIRISGTSLVGKTIVTLSGTPTTILSNTNDEIVFVPTKAVTGKIKVETLGGSVESQTNFTFINNSSATTK